MKIHNTDFSVKDQISTFFTFLNNLVNKGHNRSVKAKRNILASFVIKGCNIAVSLILVPLTINYVNPTQYGIWLTLNSIIAWFAFFDVGFGNGLRNKFAEAIAKGEQELARIYLSTTYAILSMIVIALLILFFCINPLLDWSKILNTPANIAGELSTLALLVFSFFCLQFVLQLVTTIITANQQSAKASFFNLLGSLFSLIAIFILTKITSGKLIYLALSLGLAPILVLTISSIWLYLHEYKIYAPAIKYVQLKYAKNLLNLGIQFFIIQGAAIVVFTTDNIIISQIFDPTEVTPYNISFKYFSIVIMFFSIIISPLWSSFTEAYALNDIAWIKNVIKKSIKMWVGVLIIILIMLVFSQSIYQLWVGKNIKISFLLSLSMAIYTAMLTFNMVYVNFINGISKLRIQMISSIVSIIINVPLCILFAKYLHLGPAGVMLATCVSLCYSVILRPMQCYKILNNTATGIWLK